MTELTKDTYHLLVPGEYYKLEVIDVQKESPWGEDWCLSANLVILIDRVDEEIRKENHMEILDVDIKVIMTDNYDHWDIGTTGFGAIINGEELPLDYELRKYGYLKYKFQKL